MELQLERPAVRPASPAPPHSALLALFTATFAMGTAELLVVGLLNRIAGDLGVSASTAGLAVTAYALGIAIGGPALTALTIRRPRKAVLLAAMLAYIAAQVVVLSASSFAVFVAARVATGALQGLFIGVAFAVAIGLVAPERMGRAISMVIGGVAASIGVGVPLGTLAGQGLGWRGAFIAVTVLGALALVALARFVPPSSAVPPGGLGTQARDAFAGRVLAVLGLGALLLGGQYAALTYLQPYLDRVTGISGAAISVFLLAYGAATMAGAFAGGWAADRNAVRTLLAANGVLVVALAALTVIGSTPALVALALAGWGLVGFGLVPSLQYRVTSLAGDGRDLAATLPASAVNIGIAMGSLLGGWALAHHGATAPTVAGLVVCLVAIPVNLATARLRV